MKVGAMYVALFWGTVAPEWQGSETYARIGLRMFERAQTMPGFVALHKFDMKEGRELAIAYFETEEAMRRWYNDEEHRSVETLGRSSILADYTIEILEMTRSYTKASSTFVMTESDKDAASRLLGSMVSAPSGTSTDGELGAVVSEQASTPEPSTVDSASGGREPAQVIPRSRREQFLPKP
ncbi:MAG TPA: hypothetical protein VJ777_07585 [Mycobacterium sp.]|nr:hypothetical protein [Mycobacterium sp.]